VTILLSLLLGVVSGLRALTAPMLVSWAARLGWIKLESTALAFLGYAYTPWILTVLAVSELINDKLPNTPSRTVPPQFAVRIFSGGFSAAAIAAASGGWLAGLLAGIVGAVIGTLGGRQLRAQLAASFGSDRPAALLEDALAVGGGFLLLAVLS
jgi:uncharacterized membrane protein